MRGRHGGWVRPRRMRKEYGGQGSESSSFVKSPLFAAGALGYYPRLRRQPTSTTPLAGEQRGIDGNLAQSVPARLSPQERIPHDEPGTDE